MIGGVLEDEAVAVAAALHDALTVIEPDDRDAVMARLEHWRDQVIGLLQDLEPARSTQIVEALFQDRAIAGRHELTKRVAAILQDNIDLVRASG